VEREVWEDVKSKRHEARSTYIDPPGRANHLLSGLITCELCGRNLHHHRLNRTDIYRCATGDAKPPRCLGGQIRAERAELLVTDACWRLFDLVVDPVAHERAVEFRTKWIGADIHERRTLLGSLVTKVELLARPDGNRHSKGMPIGRSLKVFWAGEWSRAAFGYSEATSVLDPKQRDIQSPLGKSWDEWRKLRILPR
jgi:hypothetical protein